MRVLVTGHLGYIGTVLVPALLRAGHDVTGLDSNLYERCTFEPGGEIVDVPFKRKDIRDIDVADLRGVDAVIHLAALSNDPLGNLDPELIFDINYRASVRLASASKKAGVRRFLFASSCSNYGLAGENMLDETGQLNPVTAYGKSKVSPATFRRVPPLEEFEGARYQRISHIQKLIADGILTRDLRYRQAVAA